MVVLLAILLTVSLAALAAVIHLYLRDTRDLGTDERELIRRMAESAYLPDEYPRSHVRPIAGEVGMKSPLQQALDTAELEMHRDASVMFADPTDASLPSPGTPGVALPYPATGEMPWEPDFDRVREEGLG